MITKPTLHCIGYASGIAATDPTCCMGPLILQMAFSEQGQSMPALEWRDMLYPPPSQPKEEALPALVTINENLADFTHNCVREGNPFLVCGGDQTSAIGAWSGAAQALSQKGSLGLIWIDAHMDSHTQETSATHNFHGMPLAILLGKGPRQLTELCGSAPQLLPQNVCLIGVRDYQAPERELLEQLGVKVIYMPEVKQRGIEEVMQEAIQHVTVHTAGYGISLDIDAIDPADAPATGLPVADGISGQALCEGFKILHGDTRLLGLEIAEFNPRLDQDQKTEQLIKQLINAVYQEK